MKKCELLMPAGTYDKFDIAMSYGADSVYLAGKRFGLRVMAGNLDNDELKAAVLKAHSLNKKVYVTVNLFARDSDIEGMGEYIQFLSDINVDAIIVADPGIIKFVQSIAPSIKIHLSTQANTLNTYCANFWHDIGVKRIVLARELTLEQIKKIREQTPDSLELEVFAHGSMCMAYSGRCAISSYLTGREANQGFCTQPCRWEYKLTEAKRDDEYFPVQEDEGGLYFFNSKDLNMLPHLDELIETGVDSLKIEGRMKSEHYVAAVCSAYRTEIDRYYDNPSEFAPSERSLEQLQRVTYRPYTTGFFYGEAVRDGQNVKKADYVSQWSYIGKVLEVYDDGHRALVKEFNPFTVGQSFEVLHPDGMYNEIVVLGIKDESGADIETAKIPKQVVEVIFDECVSKHSIIRKRVEE